MAKSKFEIYKDTKGQFRWRLIASNGETVAAGEAHKEKKVALAAVKKLKVWSNTDVIIDRDAPKVDPKKVSTKKVVKVPVKKAQVKKVVKATKKVAPTPEKSIL